MISNEELEAKFRQHPEVKYVKVSGDGYHYQLTLVSDSFIGQSKVLRQRWVYAQLKDYITTGDLHALSMNTWTQDEWEKNRG